MRSWEVGLAASLGLFACSCGEAGVYYDVKFAPGFSEGPTSVSVLGVFQEGRMSNEMWNEVDAKLAPALGQPACPVIWGEEFRRADPEIFEQIDRMSQADGITEDMLDRFSEAAEGDAIMVVSMHVRTTPAAQAQGAAPMGAGIGNPYRPGATGQMPGSRGRMSPPPRPGAIRPDRWQGQEIRLAATLFSAKRHAAMGRVVMTYLGTNVDDALKRFVKRLGEAIPGSVCKGWKIDQVK